MGTTLPFSDLLHFSRGEVEGGGQLLKKLLLEQILSFQSKPLLVSKPRKANSFLVD